jgi:hypothetical protein
VEGIDLLLARAEIEDYLTAEILALGALLVNGYDGVVEGVWPLECPLDVEVIVETKLTLLGVARGDGFVELYSPSLPSKEDH